ncbi:NAD(P)-binding Rossmann-fold superfamily protein [Striga asiatica]|uniref:NAD(P)-binding Rossmann-fold superfamily protein n=1 Tax=Striga asiatica TaxID=4170 RepID=A0A5A7QEY8_STRAF|nr:NAD(P)-binding Rossmann-fold superfamily protein [Striga asiatica]
METCRVPSHWPPIKCRFEQTSSFRAATSCCFPPNAKKLGDHSMDDRMFILGMGFVGQFFAADVKNKGWVVSGSCTSSAKKKELEELGYQAFVFDANDPLREILEIVKYHTHLVISIPPLKGLGDPLLCHKDLVESIWNSGRLRWLVYLSSTRLKSSRKYATLLHDSYQVNPASELARARLTAEEEWLRLGRNLGIAAQVFRLGGIYGPGRSAVDTILKQLPLSSGQKMRHSKRFTSRVHVADICQALHASISKPAAGKIYNIVDDDPAPREEVFELAHKLVDEKFPGRINLHISSEREKSLIMDKISGRGEKRVSNARMKKELGVKLIHPTYTSGLQSIIKQID